VILRTYFPDDAARYFLPMKIGSASAMADEGADLIIAGTKTATSSPLWHYPDGRIPFVGALSLLLDNSDRPRGIVETTRVEVKLFSAIDAAFAHDYGEGPRTLSWWQSTMQDWYRADAARHGQPFDVSTPIICERFKLVMRL
jgi:uncharacterized protein YhfF